MTSIIFLTAVLDALSWLYDFETKITTIDPKRKTEHYDVSIMSFCVKSLLASFDRLLKIICYCFKIMANL